MCTGRIRSRTIRATDLSTVLAAVIAVLVAVGFWQLSDAADGKPNVRQERVLCFQTVTDPVEVVCPDGHAYDLGPATPVPMVPK